MWALICCFDFDTPWHRASRSAPADKKPSFAIIPFDNAKGPAACPAHLLHVSEDGTASPIELDAGAFDLFEGAASECVYHYHYCYLYFPLLTNYFSLLLQINQNCLAIRGASPICQCHCCPTFSNLYWRIQESCYVEWPKLLRHIYDAGIHTELQHYRAHHYWSAPLQGYHNNSLRWSMAWIPGVYGRPLWARWNAWSLWFWLLVDSLQSTWGISLCWYVNLSLLIHLSYSKISDAFAASTPVTPKKNTKAFSGLGAAASSEWYDAKIQNCIDFDKASMSCYKLVQWQQ